jgi:hypothetical protein
MESVDFLLGNVDKQGQLEDDQVLLPVPLAHVQDLREIIDEGDNQVLRDYFTGGFDLGDLTRGTKANGDGPILPGDDARDFSDEESLAEDEGDRDGHEEDDMEVLMREGQLVVEEEEEEDRMSMDLFGPEMSSQPSGQRFGADTLIALLGQDTGEEHGLPWSDEHHDGIFDDLSPKDMGDHSEDDEMVQADLVESPETLQEPKKSAAELVKEWFPHFSPNEILRFTEVFGSQKAELNRPLTKIPRGIFLFTRRADFQFACPSD